MSRRTTTRRARIAAPKRPPTDGRIEPTPERSARNEIATETTGQNKNLSVTRRVKPVIDTLLARKTITQAEHDALNYYRQQASLCDHSPARSCLDRSVTAIGNGPSVALLSAMLETGRIERDLGSLYSLARAVAVDDISLAAWCIAKHGGRERYDGNGRFIAMVPVREKTVLAIALKELRFAAGMISK